MQESQGYGKRVGMPGTLLEVVQRKRPVHLYCLSFSENVSATYQSMLFFDLVCLLRAVCLYHEILGNVKMTEKTEAVFLPHWKENYNNMVLLQSPAAMQFLHMHNCTPIVLKFLYFKPLQYTFLAVESQLHLFLL